MFPLQHGIIHANGTNDGSRAGTESSRSSQAVRARRIHADTLPRPLRDEASQGSTRIQRKRRQGGRARRDSCRHAATASSQGSTALGRVAEREGIHADTLPRPLCDEASQRSTASAKRKQGGRAMQLDSRATGLDNNSLF